MVTWLQVFLGVLGALLVCASFIGGVALIGRVVAWSPLVGVALFFLFIAAFIATVATLVDA